MRVRLARRLLALILLVGAAAPAWSQTLGKPTGPVVLTVTGKIAATNRGPFDPARDGLFKNTKTSFERAAEFDLAMIEKLGLRAVRADFPKGGTVHRFEGPLLRDVLKAAGASGAVAKIAALDGYAQELDMREIDSVPVILAVKRDGAYLGLGGFGPAWVVFPRLDVAALKDQDDAKWIWAVIHIDVE